MWTNLYGPATTAHYSIFRLDDGAEGLEALRMMFPDGEANEMNFVLFSTSGVHGSYNTIEDAEAHLECEDEDSSGEVTFLIVHPRIVSLRYGNCTPQNKDDIEYLKQLRENSMKVIARIGMPE